MVLLSRINSKTLRIQRNGYALATDKHEPCLSWRGRYMLRLFSKTACSSMPAKNEYVRTNFARRRRRAGGKHSVMHELSVIVPIIGIADRIAQQNGIEHVAAVHMAVGELHDFEESWACKYYEKYCKDTRLEGSELKIRRIPICFRCKNCGNEITYTHFTFVNTGDIICAKCGSSEQEMISGKEMQIEGLEHQAKAK